MACVYILHNLLLYYINNKKYNKKYKTAINKITIKFYTILRFNILTCSYIIWERANVLERLESINEAELEA